MWEILQKKVHKTCITYLDEPKQQLITKRAKLDHVIITRIQTSDACSVHLYIACKTLRML